MNPGYDNSRNFKDADEFADCFNRGCELVFNYGGRCYSLGLSQDDRFYVYEVDNGTDTAYDAPEAMLDHPVGGGKRIRDVLRDMEVTDRTVY